MEERRRSPRRSLRKALGDMYHRFDANALISWFVKKERPLSYPVGSFTSQGRKENFSPLRGERKKETKLDKHSYQTSSCSSLAVCREATS